VLKESEEAKEKNRAEKKRKSYLSPEAEQSK
jgi:hypothetical protein